MMSAKTIAVWMAACVAVTAKPGELDQSFDPELRAWVAPNSVTLAPDGHAWIGGGFDGSDDSSVCDLLRLGANGGVDSEPAPGYLNSSEGFAPIGLLPLTAAAVNTPFPLTGGDFLLPTESGGWLRMNATGEEADKAFPDRQPGETITPQFERNGKLWVIRRLLNGQCQLERRASADGLPDAGFARANALPTNIRMAVPGPDYSVWVLSGDAIPLFNYWPESSSPLPIQQIFRVDATGNQIGAPKNFQIARSMRLIAGPAGAFRIEYGPNPSSWYLWPSPTAQSYRIDWYSPVGALARTRNFTVALGESFIWAEGTDGSLLASGYNGQIQKFGTNGLIDTTFPSPGRVRSINALSDGKWLIDGLRRLNADGLDDSSWTAPALNTPAQVTTLIPLADGRVLAGGNFATANGIVSNRLVMFRTNGEIDPSFLPDDRVGEWRSVAVSGRAVYVVTTVPVAYGNAVRSNLVKLGLDGTLDETFTPRLWGSPISIIKSTQLVGNVASVRALDRGCILVETYEGGDVPQSTLYRLRADGSPDPAFRVLREAPRAFGVMTRAGGGFVRGAVIYRRDGSVEKDLTRANTWLGPLCEWLGGVVFLETNQRQIARLRLWTRNGFASWFSPPMLDGNQSVTTAPGEFGTIYLAATLQDGRPAILRLLPNGRIDRTFRGPVFTNRERQQAGDWWKAEESGKIAFDPARHETATTPQVILWHPASRRLWTGGSFNMVNGRPRDGLARVMGGFSSWPWW